MWPLLLVAALFVYALHRAYRYFFSAVYHPGDVSHAATSNPDAFDNPHLHTATTATTWHMPDGITLHRFLTPSTSETPLHVICVSGGPGVASARPWAFCNSPRLRALAAFHTFHPRGAGRSSTPFSGFPPLGWYKGVCAVETKLGIAAQVADIERIRARIGAQRVAIVGHSFGGLLATLYAAEFPQHVTALALLTPANMLTLPPDGFDLFAGIRERLATEAEKAAFDACIARLLDFGSLSHATELDLQARVHDFAEWFAKVEPSASRLAERLGEDMVGGWTTYATYLSLGKFFDFRAELKRRFLHAPFRTCVVHGADDIVPISTTENYLRLFPRRMAELRVVSGGHFYVLEDNEEVTVALEKLFKSDPGT